MKRSLSANQKGQVLIEFVFGALLFLCFFIGSVQLLASQWQRLKCKKNTFEKAHQALMKKERPFLGIIETEDEIQAISFCKRGIEKVSFKKLERVQP